MKNILIITLFILITVFSYKYYLSSKENLKESFEYSKKMIKLANEINSLKNTYKPYIPRFCKKTYTKNTITAICQNMDKIKFFQFQNTLKKSYLLTFDIKKENLINAKAEIKK